MPRYGRVLFYRIKGSCAWFILGGYVINANIPQTSLKLLLQYGWKGQISYWLLFDIPSIFSTFKTSSIKFVLLCVWLMNTPVTRKPQHMSAFVCGTSLWKGPVVWLHLGLFLGIIEFRHEILGLQRFDWPEKSVRSQKDIIFPGMEEDGF